MRMEKHHTYSEYLDMALSNSHNGFLNFERRYDLSTFVDDFFRPSRDVKIHDTEA
jgi:hypothetical protein